VKLRHEQSEAMQARRHRGDSPETQSPE
jgi:hypothetical protein